MATVLCGTSLWVTPGTAGAAPAPVAVSSRTVQKALDGGLVSARHDSALYGPREPDRLRPCCAFGGVMRVKLVGLPVPWYRHEPMRGPGDIGPHDYDPGLLQLPELMRSVGDDSTLEHNGIVYTCRGGFVDTAHVRDFADLAWFLAARVENRLETGGTIDLVDYGGTRRITIRPVARQRLAAAGGRRAVAIAIAERLSFRLSVWREVATWYGYQSVPPWSEKLSSFSPEDLYSNLLGAKIAGGILRTTAIRTEVDWDRAMSEWLPAALDALRAVPIERARATMNAVDGAWWNSAKWIPDWRITVRRKFDAGPVVAPRLAHQPPRTTSKRTRAKATGSEGSAMCQGSGAPQALEVPRSVAGVSITEVASFEVVVSTSLIDEGLPLPRPGDRRIYERDLPGLIAAVRRETEAGLAADVQATQTARHRIP